MTYTVFDTDGNVIARHLSAEAAAVLVLTHGGRRFDIRTDENAGGFSLWLPQETSLPGAGLVKSKIASSASEGTQARAEIFSKVISDRGNVFGPTVIDDATYDLQLAGFENE